MPAKRIVVRGLVQGVGFRPQVARLARGLKLKGYVKNVAGGAAEIYVIGEDEKISKFINLLKKLPPPIRVEDLQAEDAEEMSFDDFIILKSDKSSYKHSQIPPDLGICEDCLREMLNPFSRRYMYPLISCAKCGPRFSMIRSLPYDRENTSMAEFPFCAECEREYRDPWDPRYHVQGFACAKCGPKVRLLDSEGRTVLVRDPIKEAAKLLDEGFIIAVKGMGGYHLAAKATEDEVVAELRRRKGRPRKPFALMALNSEVANRIVVVDDEELFNSPEAPIVLFRKREDGPLSELVAPGHALVGVMRAYTGLHYLLLNYTADKFSIMTSANPSGKPTCITKECALGMADYVLEHDREIVHRVDDSVVRRSAGERLFLRRSRGYAPAWLEADEELLSGASVGAELQNAGGISFSNKVVLTQYIGDTDEYDNLRFMEEELRWLLKQYSVTPEFVAADLHPRYSSKLLALSLAEEFGAELVEVQHHHAHAASVMAEARLEEAAAIVVDGTGYGLDGNSWGGEVLRVNREDFERVAHLEYFPLPGGDRAVKYPARALMGLLYAAGEDLEKWKGKLARALPGGEGEFEVARKVLGRSVLTSSLGRTLDAFAALLGVAYERSYEGEPAMLLEAASLGGKPLTKLDLIDGNVIKVTELLRWAVEALDSGKKLRDVAFTIQYNLGYNMALKAAELGLPVVVSGGAAVNEPFLLGVKEVVKPLLPHKVPPGDGGIALGQLIIASRKLK
ncbi:carbamoyltransferase HypF [Ignicoccus hospitalis]|uniref:Carbamoyltransferase n=1 Tax=Ignicoccus hospitalis (strain KIN4/I / DSM 18386 / JCM 14125) TaxID=453591 RepID=A8AAA4_IGNH4|nr:carbamoyltransferase HypF [Ignicoccus hospitalis]ABU81856.1 (NiFe) hydrogenase maturation protein HypF [Ignicoccus hospitalis KIN4/I]HIH90124.1 carbamoyltransferase HypF [Desulfurococcaceae archaeon]